MTRGAGREEGVEPVLGAGMWRVRWQWERVRTMVEFALRPVKAGTEAAAAVGIMAFMEVAFCEGKHAAISSAGGLTTPSERGTTGWVVRRSAGSACPPREE